MRTVELMDYNENISVSDNIRDDLSSLGYTEQDVLNFVSLTFLKYKPNTLANMLDEIDNLTVVLKNKQLKFIEELYKGL